MRGRPKNEKKSTRGIFGSRNNEEQILSNVMGPVKRIARLKNCTNKKFSLTNTVTITGNKFTVEKLCRIFTTIKIKKVSSSLLN